MLTNTKQVRLLAPATASRARVMAARIGSRLLDGLSDLPTGRGLVGNAGFALAFSSLGRLTGERRYWQAMHDCMRQAALANDKPSIGLFTGISGLRGVAAILAAEHPQYVRLIGQCDSYVESSLPTPESACVTSFSDFDIIGGWSGVRLARCVTSDEGRDRLVELLEWLLRDDARWRCVHPIRTEEPAENDLSMAHGIAGVLAALALTTRPYDTDLRRALRLQAERLISMAAREGGRTLWPPMLQGRRLVAQRAWCYGTPGTAASLYWVGRRLSDSNIMDFALAALADDNVAQADSPFWDHALCHGTLGVAMVYASVGFSSGREDLRCCVDSLVQRVLDELETDENSWWGVVPGTEYRNLAGQLDGAAGIALALATLSGDSTPVWLRLHALEPWALG